MDRLDLRTPSHALRYELTWLLVHHNRRILAERRAAVEGRVVDLVAGTDAPSAFLTRAVVRHARLRRKIGWSRPQRSAS